MGRADSNLGGMPGKRITDQQVVEYKKQRCVQTQSIAALRTGVSERSARRIDRAAELPSQRPPRTWRTREDPLASVWESELVPLLQASPGLNAVTLCEELERRNPGKFGAGVLRTIQRRLRQWRATNGEEREIYFAQEHPPARQGLSDFTVADDLGITIARIAFPHRLYQFALAHSGWRHASIVLGGESFEALASGLQSAIWNAGGAPEEHRTDSLSAAFRNLTRSEEHDLTARYASLCAHYGMRASRCNPGESHENGSIEARNGSLKNALRQALLLRGSVDFADQASYATFIEETVRQLNARIEQRFRAEQTMLRPLPERRTGDYTEIMARVSKYGIFTVKGAQYSAPSQLVGHRLIVRQFADRIECWFGGARVLECSRARRSDGRNHPRRIDYRHMVAGLAKKPGAFARWTFRDEIFPQAVYRTTWERLCAELPERESCKIMVGLLALAADGHEAAVAAHLETLHERSMLPDLPSLKQALAPRNTIMPEVAVDLPNLGSYDTLLGAEL